MNRRKLLLAVTITLLNSIANAQEMSQLYTFLINDHYSELLEKGYISKQDTLYLTCGFCDCTDNCFDYNIDIKSDMIKFTYPIINEIISDAVLYNLSTPNIEGQYITISIGIYVCLIEDGMYITEYAGTTKYIFRYNKDKSKYVFKSKEGYGF